MKNTPRMLFVSARAPVGCAVLAALCALWAGSACSERTYFCDDFADGSCRDRQTEVRTYAFRAPPKKTETWRAICDHMYFHSRETPGFRHEFRHSLSSTERTLLQSRLHCGYRLKSRLGLTEGELEGRRVDEDGAGFWCFDYLGAMLKKHLSTLADLDIPPDPLFFPIQLELWSKTDPNSPEIRQKAHITVRWTAE